MALRIEEIGRLEQISQRTELLPGELRPLGVTLTFDILYDAEVYTEDNTQRGGTWGVHFNHTDRRAAYVKLTMNGYLETSEVYFRNSRGESQAHTVYLITAKGAALLRQLKDLAGIT